MQSLSQNAIATLTGLSFIFLCTSQITLSHAAGSRQLSRASQKKSTPEGRNSGDSLTGEWRVNVK